MTWDGLIVGFFFSCLMPSQECLQENTYFMIFSLLLHFHGCLNFIFESRVNSSRRGGVLLDKVSDSTCFDLLHTQLKIPIFICNGCLRYLYHFLKLIIHAAFTIHIP